MGSVHDWGFRGRESGNYEARALHNREGGRGDLVAQQIYDNVNCGILNYVHNCDRVRSGVGYSSSAIFSFSHFKLATFLVSSTSFFILANVFLSPGMSLVSFLVNFIKLV